MDQTAVATKEPEVESPVDVKLRTPERGARLVSLDAFRGFTMFWIVGGKDLLRAFQQLDQNALLSFLTYQLDHSLWEGSKRFKVRERFNLTYMTAIQNLFNHPRFGNPNTNISAPATLGLIDSTKSCLGGRSMELRLRLEF